MKLNELFKKEENLQLEKKTLVILRWIAILGQLITIYTVYLLFKFELPVFYCSLMIIFGVLTNIYLQFFFKKNELSNLNSSSFLLFDLFQLSALIFLPKSVVLINSGLLLKYLFIAFLPALICLKSALSCLLKNLFYLTI